MGEEAKGKKRKRGRLAWSGAPDLRPNEFFEGRLGLASDKHQAAVRGFLFLASKPSVSTNVWAASEARTHSGDLHQPIASTQGTGGFRFMILQQLRLEGV